MFLNPPQIEFKPNLKYMSDRKVIVSELCFGTCELCVRLVFFGGGVAVSGEEEPICPVCARKRFLTGRRDGLPESSDAFASGLFMVSLSGNPPARSVFYLLPNLEQRL